MFQGSPSFSLPFETCSFPLLLSCIFQPLLYCGPTGERGMFAHSLCRRVRHLREQIHVFQCQPYGRKLWVVCWHMQGWDGDLALRAATIRTPHLQLLHSFHMCRLKVVTDAFMALITLYSCCPVSNSRRLCNSQRRKAHQ